MSKNQKNTQPRERSFTDQLVSKYRAIGSAAIQAAVLRNAKQRPAFKFVSTVQETD
jgi:hypothetical protein